MTLPAYAARQASMPQKINVLINELLAGHPVSESSCWKCSGIRRWKVWRRFSGDRGRDYCILANAR